MAGGEAGRAAGTRRGARSAADAPPCTHLGEEGRAWRGLVTSPRSLVFPGFCCRQHQVRSQRGLSHASQRSSRVTSQFYFLFCFARHLKINFYLHKSPRNIFSCENLKLFRQLQAPVPASSLPISTPRASPEGRAAPLPANPFGRPSNRCVVDLSRECIKVQKT